MTASKPSKKEVFGNKVKDPVINQIIQRQSSMKIVWTFILLGVFFISSNCEQEQEVVTVNDPVRFSQDFILAIKTEQSYDSYLDSLSNIDLKDLEKRLDSSSKKLAFWINTYNSLVQSKVRKDPKSFKDQKLFFNEKDVMIGHVELSLNHIETGILRRKEVASNNDFVQTFKVDKLDPRIHFTLNCGAASCPPIAYYDPERLDEQLQLATESFVSQTSVFSKEKNTLTVSELFDWYAEDFGGYEGILSLFRALKIIGDSDSPVLAYTPYNWNLDIENFE